MLRDEKTRNPSIAIARGRLPNLIAPCCQGPARTFHQPPREPVSCEVRWKHRRRSSNSLSGRTPGRWRETCLCKRRMRIRHQRGGSITPLSAVRLASGTQKVCESSHSHLLTVMLLMLFAPHPSWLIILVHHHILTLKSYGWFVTHLLISYTLMFLACTSLIVCLARDPGPVSSPEDTQGDDEETSLTEALMAPPADAFHGPGKWCKKCWAAKPERAHHCSICRRCVLKMGATLNLSSPLSRTNRPGSRRSPLPVDGK
jgi:hypothetical protein